MVDTKPIPQDAIATDPIQEEIRRYVDFIDESVLVLYNVSRNEVRLAQEAHGRLEQEIMRRMEERGSIAIPSERFICELKVSNSYDPAALTPLKEIFNEQDLASCFTLAHEETVTVPEKWSVTKVMPLARRYGQEALDLVESAKVPTSRGLKFDERPSQGDEG